MQKYTDVKLPTYTVLLNGNTKKNQCGGKLTDKYYQFSAINKETRKEVIFCLGYDCGEQLLQLIEVDIKSVRLFNPLQEDRQQNIGGNMIVCGRERTQSNETKSFTKLGRELFDLINLIYIGVDIKKSNTLYDLTQNLYKYYDKDPFPSAFKAINTYLKKADIIIENILKKISMNNRIRNFNFNASREYLLKDSKFDDEVRF